ncbi:MAG: amidohydrolase [Chloroflexi bacterium]|nr:amidohydrolase [Chloroflexota bacterium]
MIDRIVYNAKIHTLNPKQPQVTALAIIGERIVALGDDNSIRQLAGPNTRQDNAGGRVIIPGLTDAHLHWEGYSKTRRNLNLMDVPSKNQCLAMVAERARTTPPGEWIIGRGWRLDTWHEIDYPLATEIDAITTQHPVYLGERSGHAAWVNSLALKVANVHAGTSDPLGGTVVRLPDSSPSGMLLEDTALHLVSDHIGGPTPEKLADYMADAQAHALRQGLTGFHDYDNPSCMVALQILRERGQLGMRVVKQVNVPWIEYAHAAGLRSGFGDDWIRIGGLKIFADGALGPRTALMIEPYENEPNNYGICVTDKEEIYSLVSRASAQGVHTSIHAIGDKAVHDVLDIFETVREEEAGRGTPRSQLRHRIEHVQIIHPSDVGRLVQLNVIASMQPIHATSDLEMADLYWGKRAEYSYAIRKQLNAGAVLAFGSDAPVEDLNPWRGIHAAVTRQRADGSPGPEGWYPEERLSLHETLIGFTQGPAFAAYMENRLGVLAPGYLADMVMLDRDLFGIAPTEILNVQALGTMVGGEWRFKAFD